MIDIDIDATIKKYHGRTCWAGLDLGATSDFSAAAYLFDAPCGVIDIIARFWCPSARLYDKKNRYRDQYRMWVDAGWMKVTDGNSVDYDVILADIVRDSRVVMIDSMNIDRLFQGAHMLNKLTEAGVNVVGLGMGYVGMAVPMRRFEQLLLDKKLNHGGNPVMRFCADNVAVSRDPTDNLKPNKAASQGKIDGIVAVVLALDRWVRSERQHGPAGDGSAGIIY